MDQPIRYDFDMIPVVPGEKRGELLLRGVFDPRLEARVALFRDRRAVRALRAAPAPVRELFSAAGFGMGASGSPVPAGCFRPEEAPARGEMLARLHGLMLADYDTLRAAEWGVFALDRFLAQAAAARPLPAAPGGPGRSGPARPGGARTREPQLP